MSPGPAAVSFTQSKGERKAGRGAEMAILENEKISSDSVRVEFAKKPSL
jgi:hypothetical protein